MLAALLFLTLNVPCDTFPKCDNSTYPYKSGIMYLDTISNHFYYHYGTGYNPYDFSYFGSFTKLNDSIFNLRTNVDAFLKFAETIGTKTILPTFMELNGFFTRIKTSENEQFKLNQLLIPEIKCSNIEREFLDSILSKDSLFSSCVLKSQDIKSKDIYPYFSNGIVVGIEKVNKYYVVHVLNGFTFISYYYLKKVNLKKYQRLDKNKIIGKRTKFSEIIIKYSINSKFNSNHKANFDKNLTIKYVSLVSEINGY